MKHTACFMFYLGCCIKNLCPVIINPTSATAKLHKVFRVQIRFSPFAGVQFSESNVLEEMYCYEYQPLRYQSVSMGSTSFRY